MANPANGLKRFRLLSPVAALSALLCVTLPSSAQGRPAASVFVAEVAEQDFAMRIEALGTLMANERVDLTLNVADRVTAIYFDDGERVVAGKTLLSLAQREQVALVEAAEANADEARRQFERAKQLSAQDAIAQTALDAARRDLDNANAQLRAVQVRQKDRVLVAPFAGVLGFRMVSVGSYVRPGDIVATLVDDSEMKLDFSVPSIFLQSLKPGVEVTTTTDDLEGVAFSGVIDSIDNSIDPVTRSVRVRAILPNNDQQLKAGMFMRVTIVADPRKSLAIPEGAIQPLGPDNFVYLAEAEDGKLVARRHKIEIGLRQGGDVEVLSGLKSGDRVVTEGAIRIRDGAEVQVRDRSAVLPGSSGNGAAANAQ
ncbi:MAG: efflux RND transporter periplasmic adaptor subunit [Hyphomonas sp.]